MPHFGASIAPGFTSLAGREVSMAELSETAVTLLVVSEPSDAEPNVVRQASPPLIWSLERKSS